MYRTGKGKLSSIFAKNSVEHIDFLDYQTDDTFDCIVMDNVIEHMVPDTTGEVLKKCYNLLNIRGYLVVLTTHRFSGPHDISKFFLPFGAKTEGFHLKEFSFIELEDALVKAGFQQIFGFPFHPRLLWKFNIVPRPSVWAARKARFIEKIIEMDSLSKMLTINRTLTSVMVATLFPAIAVGAKKNDNGFTLLLFTEDCLRVGEVAALRLLLLLLLLQNTILNPQHFGLDKWEYLTKSFTIYS
ncbi:hypothetical protein LCGC14_2527740 [marine sediment metagenome]|uniref:Uncharacterized protein n=1 Tax=marine sediment metagenome TaxID=412755 RepID=A0A0F9D654_9ZZZZ